MIFYLSCLHVSIIILTFAPSTDLYFYSYDTYSIQKFAPLFIIAAQLEGSLPLRSRKFTDLIDLLL